MKNSYHLQTGSNKHSELTHFYEVSLYKLWSYSALLLCDREQCNRLGRISCVEIQLMFRRLSLPPSSGLHVTRDMANKLVRFEDRSYSGSEGLSLICLFLNEFYDSRYDKLY
jgi:hypothetical protein